MVRRAQAQEQEEWTMSSDMNSVLDPKINQTRRKRKPKTDNITDNREKIDKF